MMSFLESYWERLLFFAIGIVLMAFAFSHLVDGSVTEASAIFALSFFSFIYGNLARFKRFKGLGFEAELWEDKQKEAADLIEQLKSVVSIYSREVILQRVKQGRYGSGSRWADVYSLFDELGAQHKAIGQEIDFSDLKREVDKYFLFDLAMKQVPLIVSKVNKGRAQARKLIETEFGSQSGDGKKHAERIKELHKITDWIDNPFNVAESQDLAEFTLDWAEKCKVFFKERFEIEIDYESKALDCLSEVSKLYKSQPIEITPAILELVEGN